jgi:hypothetical protein
MAVDFTPIEAYAQGLDPAARGQVDAAVERIVACKQAGRKVIVATGSGPNVHEGVTTLVAHLIDRGIVDGVSTSAAVVAHALAGTLDRVWRVDGRELGAPAALLPMGGKFEITRLSAAELAALAEEMALDRELLARAEALPGDEIIKAAGNMAYPMGLRTERLAREILAMARAYGLPFEVVAGWGADPRTMLGAAARRGVPVLVSVPQMIGGGAVGLAVADSIPVSERCMRLARLIDGAGVLIESAVALTQEIHDGPFECYTGHGIWAGWDGYQTTRLEGKTLIRIDLDRNLQTVWEMQRANQTVQAAIDRGLPKTKLTGIPFRMEMSGFARLEGSLPIVSDIGVIWPVLAWKVSQGLGIDLDFISHPQQTPAGQAMREWIVREVRPFDRAAAQATAQAYRPW